MLRQFERHLTEQDWTEVQSGVEVKQVVSADGQEQFVLARSPDRRAKEKAMHERFLQRMEDGLKRLQVAVEQGRLRTKAKPSVGWAASCKRTRVPPKRSR
jgi:hypothetical protein